MWPRSYTGFLWILLLMFVISSCNINTPEVKQHKIEDDTKLTGLPVIIINSNHDINLLEKVICEISIKDSLELNQNQIVAKIKTRMGDFGDKNPKPSYSITLTRSTSLLGMQADHEWILNGSYIDKTFLRDKLVYDLFARMDPSIYTATTEYVNLYLNGQYKGLYLLTEKLNENRLNLETENRFAIIFKEPEIFSETGRIYNQKYPDPGLEDRSKYILEIRDIQYNSSDEAFYDYVSKHFDLKNLANLQLLLQLTNNSQGLFSSFYLYRKSKDDKFRFTVWDYDGSFGRNWDGSLQKEKIDINKNVLLKRLNESESFRILLQNQWHNLREDKTISIKIINGFINSNLDIINESVVENVKLYPLDGPLYYDAYTLQQEIDLLHGEILSQINYLDSLYIFENETPVTELSD